MTSKSLSADKPFAGASDDKKVSQKIVIGVSVPLVAVLVFLLIWLIISLKHRRLHHHDEGNFSPQRIKNREPRLPKKDGVAKPLFPHNKTVTSSSPSTESTRRYGSIALPSRTDSHGDEDISNLVTLPELQNSPIEGSEHSAAISSSDDDFGAHFSGLEDPFSDGDTAAQHNPVVTAHHAITSPSSYPLRDRVGHESGRRRRAIESVNNEQGMASLRRDSPRRRSSFGEEELRFADGFDWGIRGEGDGEGDGKLGKKSRSFVNVSKLSGDQDRRIGGRGGAHLHSTSIPSKPFER